MKKILFIDDDEILQSLVEQLLKAKLPDCEVMTASTDKDGIEMAKRNKPSAIVLDIMLQEENGWETALTLKKTWATRDIPIIIASGAGSPFEEHPYVDQKLIAAYIRKPYDTEELADTIRHILG